MALWLHLYGVQISARAGLLSQCLNEFWSLPMLRPHFTSWIVLIVALASCGASKDGGRSALMAESDLMSSVGKGSKILLTQDFEIPANTPGPQIATLQYTTERGYGYRYIEYYKHCGLEMREATVERRVIKAGSEIEFSGKVSTGVDRASGYSYEMLEVIKPEAVNSVYCYSLIRDCNDYTSVCPAWSQDKFKISDFRLVIKKIGTLEIAPPIVIPTN